MNINHKEFERVETEQSLFEIYINDIPIWERIRFKIYREISRDSGAGKAHTSISQDLCDYLSGGYLLMKNIFLKNPYFANEANTLFIGHPRRKKESDGYWWDIYCDPIHEASQFEYIHIEPPYLLNHHQPARTENLRYLDIIKYSSKLQRMLGVAKPEIPTSKKKRLRSVQHALKDEFNVDINLLPIVRRELHVRKTRLWMYRRLLKQIDPEIAVIVVNYKETFIEACREQNIPVVELQHGGFGPDHPGYSFPGNRTKETFPDYLFTFGDFWKERVEFPIPDEKVYPVGHPYLEKQKERYSSINSEDTVLFISQGPVGEKLTKLAVEYAQLEDKYEVIVKLHPGEYDRWKESYPWLVDAPLTVIDGDEPPLYKLLATASVQVGVTSTVIYEGLVFGNNTYLLDYGRPLRTEHLVEEGQAEFVSSGKDLYEVIRDCQDSPAVDVSYYFKENPIENIESAFEEIRQQTQL